MEKRPACSANIPRPSRSAFTAAASWRANKRYSRIPAISGSGFPGASARRNQPSSFDAAIAGNPLAAIGDKFSLPTSSSDLGEWGERLIDTKVEGVIHACNPGEPVSWQGMAEFIVREMAKRGVIPECPPVTAQTLEETSAFRAPRPRFSCMDTAKLATLLGKPLRPWKDALAEHIALRCAAR